jgi:hypothetical protein
VLPGFGIPAVQKSARRELATRHAGDQHAVRDDRRARRGIALFVVGELLLPHLFARLHVERDDVVVERDAIELAVV